MKNKRRLKKIKGKVVHGSTPEERFKEIHGMTIEEWHEQQFKAKTGMTPDEWYINEAKSTTPIDFIKERYDTVTEDDVKLVKDMQMLGLTNEVINVLLDYVAIISRIGVVHPLVREMGKNWVEKDILTIEKAIAYVREEQKKYKLSEEK
ncbi:DnaD domain protein [Neobacillus niacini]|uniref:DnaD domain protein n=1 Tax=Neobacillus niacini TaxID=86668 RepID=UPI0005EDE4CF|nr:DnaD domain protein [Neobacillus niacini]